MILRTTRTLLVAAGVALALGGGCGSSSESSHAPTTTSADATTVPGAPITPGARRVTPQPGARNPRRQRFESATADGDGLLVTYWSGVPPCTVLDHVDVEEHDDRVVVTLWVGAGPKAAGMVCIEMLAQYEVRVSLHRALGGRSVVDGAA